MIVRAEGPRGMQRLGMAAQKGVGSALSKLPHPQAGAALVGITLAMSSHWGMGENKGPQQLCR